MKDTFILSWSFIVCRKLGCIRIVRHLNAEETKFQLCYDYDGSWNDGGSLQFRRSGSIPVFLPYLEKSPAVDNIDAATTCKIQFFQFGASVDDREESLPCELSAA